MPQQNASFNDFAHPKRKLDERYFMLNFYNCSLHVVISTSINVELESYNLIVGHCFWSSRNEIDLFLVDLKSLKKDLQFL